MYPKDVGFVNSKMELPGTEIQEDTVYQVCRFCLGMAQQTADIFTSFYAKENLLYCDMILDCTKLQLYKGDGLPSMICKDCSRQMKRSYAFNKLCQDSDRKLRHHKTANFDENGDLEVIVNSIDQSDNEAKNVDVVVKTEYKLPIPILHVNEYDRKDLNETENHDEECSWDDDDDNLVLEQIKINKHIEELANQTTPTKNKRGQKKKAQVTQAAWNGSEVTSSKLPHQCDECGKVFSTRSNMLTHKISHTNLRPYTCDDCPATFRGHSALGQHKKTHTGETPYECTHCSKQFRRRDGFINHVRIHTGDKRYTCDICLKAFVQSGQLYIHMKRHKGSKSFLCQDCGKGFAIKADLKVHQRMHNGEKPYSCTMCTKTFATAGNLSIHKRIHNKDIRYTCKECSRGFVTPSSYAVHLKRHKGQRDYSCECGKTFYTSSALKQHRVVHTGEKKYQCKICERKFTQAGHLSRHVKRDHSKPNAPVPASNAYKRVSRNMHEPFQASPAHVQRTTTTLDVS